jgi:DNA helicase HerA-like ATPase
MAETKSELDDFFPRDPRTAEAVALNQAKRLGMVVAGSLSKGLDIKLDRDARIEETAVGRYVVVQSGDYRFFSLITDVALDNTNPLIEKMPPDADDDFVREVMQGTSTFGRLHVSPMLVLAEGAGEPKPVKTVPGHFAPAYEATPQDVSRIFGDPSQKGYFEIGEPLDMEGIKIYLDLKRFAERSSGVFGKSGTGKTYLTRMLLAGMIQENIAVNLVFDMHNEYGWEGSGEFGKVKALKQLYGNRTAIFTLDEESSRRRGSKVDYVVRIGFDTIEPEDVESISGILNLSDVQRGALYTLRKKLGRDWIGKLLQDKVPEELAESLDQKTLLAGTLGAIQRKLDMFARFGFMAETARESAVDRVLEYLQKGVNVVIEFGRYGNSLEAYILVANFLTRRIHKAYVERKEAAQGGGAGYSGDEPRQLVITIEEAHKFLDPLIAKQTIFGTISRELRKYNVTLLIVDQRPSGIDPEVMSQIGTRVTCLLDDEQDIRAVFSGIGGAGELRQVLARLDTRQQALILGHAVPMPVVVRTRKYDEAFYAAAGFVEGDELQSRRERGSRSIYGDEDDELN